ncbi:hypothetical protein [Ichthyobacterium seriolicida]|uniref:Uncharacterized protein n=1 Tax=Ichthyobacterium seriolicida TaxID=242600 RepID=A0A1J1E7M4_9FLAO|nr:hypothetical protein [Ichthyobacterium seriolicida]BAV95334.1 hypothetical protein JBKA6_1321 [Ichthyobacterium seriolicida]
MERENLENRRSRIERLNQNRSSILERLNANRDRDRDRKANLGTDPSSANTKPANESITKDKAAEIKEDKIREKVEQKIESLNQEEIDLSKKVKKQRNKLILSRITNIIFIILFSGIGYLVFIEKLVLNTGENNPLTQKLDSLTLSNTELLNNYNELLKEKEQIDSIRKMQYDFSKMDLIYSLQIASYKKNELKFISDSYVNMLTYGDDNIIKYSLGIFKTYDEMLNFMRQLQTGGIDCFPVAKSKGKDITIEEAKQIENSIAEKN